MAMDRRYEIFAKAPVKQAVLSQIIPAVASQMIALIYNLADTYFVGMLDDPVQTATITVVYPSFVMLTALSNLFGVGGASAIARSLGAGDARRAGEISAVSFWGGLGLSLLFSGIFAVFHRPLLALCGAAGEVETTAAAYARWVVVFGGPFTVLNTLLANLIRAEGAAAHSAVGVSLGGILNILLDPLFVLPGFLGFGAEGAGMATAISNGAATAYFLGYLLIKHKTTVLSLSLRKLQAGKRHVKSILSIGFPSALQYALTVVAVAAQSRFVAAYSTKAVAALGIVKKLDQLPLYFSIGVSNGLLPLLAYNHSAGSEDRRRQAFRLGAMISVGFALLCLLLYEGFAPGLVGLFIKEPDTVVYGTVFLRIMVTAMPLMAFCYPMIIQFQAMGRAGESLVCSLLRKGVLDVPLLFLFDRLLPLYGCMWVQPAVDLLSLMAAAWFYRRLGRQRPAGS